MVIFSYSAIFKIQQEFSARKKQNKKEVLPDDIDTCLGLVGLLGASSFHALI